MRLHRVDRLVQNLKNKYIVTIDVLSLLTLIEKIDNNKQ